MQLQTETILTGYSEQEKAAYLGALAALATADREADQEEQEHLREVAQAAGISPEQEEEILHAAKDVSGQDLKRCLDVLKGSELRYSLITDLIAVAKADESYSEQEKGNIEKVSQYLNVNKNQFDVLDQAVAKTVEAEQTPEEISKPNFLQSLGMQDKFSNAGFNMGSISKIFGFLGPILLGGMAAKALGGRRSPAGMGGLGGGLLGGMLGGGNRMATGVNRGGGMGLPGGLGGLGSLISGLNRSRGNQSMGGLLGKLFR